MDQTPELRIRPTTKKDVPLILSFIREIAEYEKLLSQVVATERILEESLFGASPAAEVLIAEYEGRPAAFAVYFYNFSTFLGRPGLYLEDLFVKPEYRRRGIGKEFLNHLIGIAKEKKCGRMEWSVLDWNEPAIEFYKSLGARPMSEWTVFRLEGIT